MLSDEDAVHYPKIVGSPASNPQVDFYEGLYIDYRAWDKMGLEPLIPFGIEISAGLHAVADAVMRKRGGHAVHAPGIEGLKTFEADFFDGVLMSSILEHEKDPKALLRGIHRVLKPGGTALVIDLRPDASPAALAAHVDGVGLGWFSRLLTKWTFKHMLLKRAYTQAQFREMAAPTPFGGCEIREGSIGLEVSFVK